MTRTLIATLLAFAAVPASAEPPSSATVKVQLADLDLSTTQGQRALDRRLIHAVKEVCGTASNTDLKGRNEVRRCRRDTLAGLADEREQRIAAASEAPIKVAAR